MIGELNEGGGGWEGISLFFSIALELMLYMTITGCGEKGGRNTIHLFLGKSIKNSFRKMSLSIRRIKRNDTVVVVASFKLMQINSNNINSNNNKYNVAMLYRFLCSVLWWQVIENCKICLVCWDKKTSGVNLTNIFHAVFSYESVMHIFLVHTNCGGFFLAKAIDKKAARKMLVKLTTRRIARADANLYQFKCCFVFAMSKSKYMTTTTFTYLFEMQWNY